MNAMCMSSRKMAGTTSSSSGTPGRESKRAPPVPKAPAPAPLTSLPVKPTRPATAYALFVHQRHVQLKQQNPGALWMEAQKLASAEWKTVNDSVRQRLEGQRKEADEKYKQQLKQYKIQLKQTVVLADVMKLVLKKKSDPSNVKKKLSGYNVFVTEKTSGKQGAPDLKAIAKDWSSLTEWEKKRYNDKAAASLSSTDSS